MSIYGILSPAGAKVGSVKKISTETTGLSLGGIALAGGKFLVTYSVFDIATLTVKLYGRFVTSRSPRSPIPDSLASEYRVPEQRHDRRN